MQIRKYDASGGRKSLNTFTVILAGKGTFPLITDTATYGK